MKQGDEFLIAANLRPDDAAEAIRVTGLAPIMGILASIHVSTMVWTLLDDSGEPFALVGVGPSSRGDAYADIWMVATAGIEKVALKFLRSCKAFLATIQHGRTFHCTADAQNLLHRKWLLWLGFEPTGVILEHGASQTPFIEFERKP